MDFQALVNISWAFDERSFRFETLLDTWCTKTLLCVELYLIQNKTKDFEATARHSFEYWTI